MASSVCPARRSLRMWDAEAIPSAAPPSWGPPRRGNVIGSMEKSARRRAFRAGGDRRCKLSYTRWLWSRRVTTTRTGYRETHSSSL